MLRTSMTVAAIVLVGVAVLFASRNAISNESAANASAVSCPCGQCDSDCTCCTDENVSCDNCACDTCECTGCESTEQVASQPRACCSGKASCDLANASVDAGLIASVDDIECACGECDADCKCCSDQSVSCDDCSCESCECSGCVEETANNA